MNVVRVEKGVPSKVHNLLQQLPTRLLDRHVISRQEPPFAVCGCERRREPVQPEPDRVLLPDLGVRDLAQEHLVDDGECRVQEQERVYQLLLLPKQQLHLAVVFIGVRFVTALVLGRQAQRADEAQLVLLVLQVRDRLDLEIVDLLDDRKDVGVVDDRIAVPHAARDDELIRLLDVGDLLLDLGDVDLEIVDQ